MQQVPTTGRSRGHLHTHAEEPSGSAAVFGRMTSQTSPALHGHGVPSDSGANSDQLLVYGGTCLTPAFPGCAEELNPGSVLGQKAAAGTLFSVL